MCTSGEIRKSFSPSETAHKQLTFGPIKPSPILCFCLLYLVSLGDRNHYNISCSIKYILYKKETYS